MSTLFSVRLVYVSIHATPPIAFWNVGGDDVAVLIKLYDFGIEDVPPPHRLL